MGKAARGIPGFHEPLRRFGFAPPLLFEGFTLRIYNSAFFLQRTPARFVSLDVTSLPHDYNLFAIGVWFG